MALALIKLYRLIPARIRRLWSFGTSTSHLALAAAMNGEGWSAFRYARLVTVPPFKSRSWWAPSQNISIAWKLGEGGKGAP